MIELKIPDRKVYFCGQVEQKTVNDAIKDILSINEQDDKIISEGLNCGITYNPKPIELIIDSYGGYVYQGLGLVNIIKNSKTPVHTIVAGCAMSMGFIMAICGHMRFAHQDSTFMYHQLWSWSIGPAQQMEEDLKENIRLQEILESITLKNTKITKSRLAEIRKCKEDWYITPKEALKLGIIDGII